MKFGFLLLGLLVASFAVGGIDCGKKPAGGSASAALLNVSYDPTRELYVEVNQAFIADYEKQTGVTLTIAQSHSGSGKQARSVADGLNADVVTLALAYDIDSIAKSGLIDPDWQKRLPDHSAPYTSTIVLLVRKGNPKAIHDWADLVRPGIAVITPSPKTSGGARWNYLAAWGYKLNLELGDLKQVGNASDAKVIAAQAKAKDFVADLYRHVSVLDSGARGATTTFAQRNIGDVLITWENEAFLAQREFGQDNFEIVRPSISILAEPPVSVVDKNVDRKHTRVAAEAYLKFLYTDAAQEIIARNFYRPRNAAIAAKYADKLPAMNLFTVDDIFGGWTKAQADHFADGGVFDQITADQITAK